MKVINFFGGPGCGKSTTAAGLFYKLKKAGINVELINEYAKDKVWEGHTNILEDQLYVFAKQLRKIRRLENKVDIVISDSPILLGAYYIKYDKYKTPGLREMIIDTHHQMESMNIFVHRTKPYNPIGRLGGEDSAKEKDIEIEKLLKDANVQYKKLVDNEELISKIYEDILCLL